MTRFWKVLFLALIFSLSHLSAHTQTPPKHNFHIVGYLPDYRLDVFAPPVTRVLTDLIYFSIEPNADGSLKTDRYSPEAKEKMLAVRDYFSGRLLIALGGLGRSGEFAKVATNAKKRDKFVRSLIQFCDKNDFQGVDFDWEHPRDKAEVKAYSDLIAATKKAFRPHNLFLSVTLAQAKHLNAKGFQAADRVQIMSYNHPGRHSTLKQMQADVASFLKAGVPKSKLCPGIPFYGRSLKDWNTTITYADIRIKFQIKKDDDEAGGFYFNGVETVEKKMDYIRDNKLRGAMCWELGQDTRDLYSLLRAVHRVLSGKEEREKKEPNK